MKVRNGYVSNSSSSSFIIAGNNVMEILKKNLGNSSLIKDDFLKFECSAGDIVKEIVNQCKDSTVDLVKGVVNGLVYESSREYFLYVYYKVSGDTPVCYDWQNVREDKWYDRYIKETVFDINKKAKDFINKGVKDIYNQTKSKREFDYYKVIDSDDYKSIMDEIVESIYTKLASENQEMYAVSFGDNHGACSGNMGWVVEDYFLGQKAINNYLGSDFQVYHYNCH